MLDEAEVEEAAIMKFDSKSRRRICKIGLVILKSIVYSKMGETVSTCMYRNAKVATPRALTDLERADSAEVVDGQFRDVSRVGGVKTVFVSFPRRCQLWQFLLHGCLWGRYGHALSSSWKIRRLKEMH